MPCKVEVQIYEIQDPREAEEMARLGVDRVGSVIVSETDWKDPAIREAIRVSRSMKMKHSLIPLFNTSESLFRVIEYYNPHVIHFCESLYDRHGRATSFQGLVELQGLIRDRFPGVEVMRSIPVVAPPGTCEVPSLAIARQFEPVSDYFLTDTWLGKEPISGYIGITGLPCDWRVARALVRQSIIPVFLAGGLSPENVYEGVSFVWPAGADSCTQTNALDHRGRPIRFKKDLEKVQAFVSEVRRAGRDLENLTS